ncbi:hypothetical protein [Jatrophihabitans sp.]|jgi:hypothetical protein|uniref:hypothetical protein n=1 Tax=Jatrophihabitans sp. TaxID=1932789 RepID=UPI002EF8E787
MADISRRTLLSRALLGSALAGGALLGLTRPIKHKVAVPPPPPPVALTAALARQRHLLDGYDLVLANQPAHPGLAGLRADVAAHGNALRAVLQHYPGWRLSTSSTVSGSRTPGSSVPPGSRTPGSSLPPGTTAAGTGSPVTTLPALAAASRSAAAATSQACLDWPATEAHAGEVVPLLGSIAACLTSHSRVLG